ncbi:hypothetical protein HanHA89_Chr08g0289051 [Helianthus annuus]|nr:hypothetical protein HanHA89_Chr08g0289051 [Helianthus annuus]
MADDQKEAAAAAVVHTPDHTPPNPLSSFFSNFTQLINFRFPPKKLETENKSAAGNTVFRTGEPAEDSKPVTVRFSDARPATVAPLKLEAEEVEKDTNPVFLWQLERGRINIVTFHTNNNRWFYTFMLWSFFPIRCCCWKTY